MRVSVVVPTLNGGKELEELLAAIARQRLASGSFEIVAADSGSTDGTRERLASAGATVIDVPKGSFDHGATRDLAISRSTGEIAVLVVQDAVPGSDDWLAGLVREFDDPKVAATTCRQVARAEHPALTAARLCESPYGSMERRSSRLEDGVALASLPPLEQLRLCTLDNVCSAVRRSVWETIRFGPCAFGEDLAWAKQAIAAGWTITYTPDVHVVHSHDRSVVYEYRRTYLNHFLLHRLFGVRTVPRVGIAWRSLWTSGGWMRTAWRGERSLGRKLAGVLRAPTERFATALAQYEGGRDSAEGRPARRFKGI